MQSLLLVFSVSIVLLRVDNEVVTRSYLTDFLSCFASFSFVYIHRVCMCVEARLFVRLDIREIRFTLRRCILNYSFSGSPGPSDLGCVRACLRSPLTVKTINSKWFMCRR